MLESQRSRSNLDQDWLRGMEIVSEGMLESQQSRSNLDQNWLRGMEIVSEGMLESQQSRSNLDQNWLRGMEIVSRRYARNTAVSVKSGVSIGILPAGMLESKDLREGSDPVSAVVQTMCELNIFFRHLPCKGP